MTARRSAVGLAVLCALALSAFTAANASAAGTTAFTCVSGAATQGFSDPDCETASATGPYHHVEIVGLTKEVTGTGGEFKLKGKTGGVAAEIICKKAMSEGAFENKVVSGVMQNVSESQISTFEECTAPAPVGQSCKIKGGSVTSNSQSTTIEGTGATATGVKFTPKTGSTVFAEFFF